MNSTILSIFVCGYSYYTICLVLFLCLFSKFGRLEKCFHNPFLGNLLAKENVNRPKITAVYTMLTVFSHLLKVGKLRYFIKY